MTPAEYVQLKAFARVDGLLLALLWSASFACYILGLSQPMLAMAALGMVVATPFVVGSRLRRFRDEARQGIISLKRGWAYAVLVFFYGGVLLALVQYVYLAYMDKGYLAMALGKLLSSPENQLALSQLGLGDQVAESMALMEQTRPIDFVLNMLTMNILAGIVLGLPIAAVMRRQDNNNDNNNGHINSNPPV